MAAKSNRRRVQRLEVKSGVPAFAPALANAIFTATHKRIRKMPFDLNNI